MAENSLRRLRRAAGYTSAKAFAEVVGIPAPTYAKYEQGEGGPETGMPIRNAWLIADALGCSIDAVVGRDDVPEAGLSGEVQRRFDALSEDGKQLVMDFLGMAEMREERAEAIRRREIARRYRREARQYELQFFESLQPEEGEFMDLGSDEDMRTAYQAFIEAKIREADARSIERVMSMPGVAIEYDGSQATRPAPSANEERLRHYRNELVHNAPQRQREVIEGIMAAYDEDHPGHPGETRNAVVRLK